jgi:hypothetical protein
VLVACVRACVRVCVCVCVCVCVFLNVATSALLQIDDILYPSPINHYCRIAYSFFDVILCLSQVSIVNLMFVYIGCYDLRHFGCFVWWRKPR